MPLSHIRTTFHLVLDDEMPEDAFAHIVVRVGKSLGLRGIARELQFEGRNYYILVEGYDYQTADYVKFFRIGNDAIGKVSLVKNTPLASVSDMRLPDGFWCARAPRTQIPETDSDDGVTGEEKLLRYKQKKKRRTEK